MEEWGAGFTWIRYGPPVFEIISPLQSTDFPTRRRILYSTLRLVKPKRINVPGMPSIIILADSIRARNSGSGFRVFTTG